MRRQRHSVSEDKHHAFKTEVERCRKVGQVRPAAQVARAAGTTETFIYRHERTPCALCLTVFDGTGPVAFYRHAMTSITASSTERAEADADRETASLRAQLANEKGTSKRLRHQLRALEARLGKVEGERAVETISPSAPIVDQSVIDRLRTAEQRAAQTEEEIEALRRLNTTLTRDLNQTAPAPTAAQLAENVEELRALLAAFDDVRPQDMTPAFYIRAFNEYDLNIRALIETYDEIRGGS